MTAEFRRLLRAHRTESGQSQLGLALSADLDHSLVSRLECGERNPTRESIERLCRGLGLNEVDAVYLGLSAGFVPLELSADRRRAVARYLTLPPELS